MKKFLNFMKSGIIVENPALVCGVALCPLLGASKAMTTGLAMGIIALFVLVVSGVVVSLIRKIIPQSIKAFVYMLVAACFVTVADIVLRAFFPIISAEIGIYLPLLAVSGIIFTALEDVADKNCVKETALRACASGIGFLVAILILSAVREIVGCGTFFDIRIFPEKYAVMLVSLPGGGLIVCGILAAIFKKAAKRFGEKEEEEQ